MKQNYLIVIVLIAVAAAGYMFFGRGAKEEQAEQAAQSDYKNIAYTIDSQKVTLVNGTAQTDAAPGSASKIVTQYFGNELKTDLNGDGKDDVVFLLTQQTGGSGTFYYVVAAVSTPQGYVGSDAYLLGDRIAPQTTELSQNPNLQGVVVVNYADRAPGEPMTTRPSIGKSAYLKLDPATMTWTSVTPSAPKPQPQGRGGIQGTVMLGPTCPVMQYPSTPECADKPYATALVVTYPNSTKTLYTFASDANGKFSTLVPAGTYVVRRAPNSSILPRCAPSNTITVRANSYVTVNISCDTGIR